MNFPYSTQYKTFIVFGLLFLLSFSLIAQNVAVNAQSVAKNLFIPWDLEYWGNDTLIFTQKSGEIIRLDIQNEKLDTLFVIEGVAELQHSGLMGMALHPNWPSEKEIFVAYAFYDAQFQVLIRLEKMMFDPSKDSLASSSILLDSIPGAATTTGARVITSGEHVYLSTGDINLGTVSQDTNSLNGKILRLHLDGSIPNDNPISGSPIWTLGHRNPQGLAISPEGNFFSCEHGASANDEINLIEKGRNYGWPEVSGFCNGEPACQALNLVDPLNTWSPPIAPCGLAYVDNSQVLDNGLLMAGLRGTALYWVKLNAAQSGIDKIDTLLPTSIGRIRDVLVTGDNRIFISTSNVESQNPVSSEDDQIFELFTGFVSNDLSFKDLSIKVYVYEKVLHVLDEDGFKEELSWNLFSLDGKKLKGDIISPRPSSMKVNLSEWPSGYYFVSIVSPKGHFYQKIYLAPR
ncbi:MAG: PQQ-dependent sugar dehydrogenase [Bacteroidia bacterium]|nr:PQQ-dependent sugar dehydrogenase [Bacteroidia bacterium]